MNILGLSITRQRRKAIGQAFTSVLSGVGWGSIRESFVGAWQQNVTVNPATVEAYWAVFSCVTLIASDVAKLRAWVMRHIKAQGIFEMTLQRPVLQKPNSYQTRIEFFFEWVKCLLLQGNTYVLKARNAERQVIALYILDPYRCKPLLTPDGGVYYELCPDVLSRTRETVIVPASEIIHDRMYTLHHPLVGVSPIYACGVAAMKGAAIENNSTHFFGNSSRPAGILLVPGEITQEDADRLKANWETNYGGANSGKTAVLADGLKYEPISVSAQDSQMIEQLKMTAEMICACFHVPGYKIGVGQMPTVSNTAMLNQQYFDQCLQFIIEKMELRIDEGLEIEYPFETWFDIKNLLRMDPEARFKSYNESIQGGWMAPNEARREEDMLPVPGGDTPYLQQQNYSLAALAKRDASDDPFASAPAAPPVRGPKPKPDPSAPEPSAPPKEIDPLVLEELFCLNLTRALLEAPPHV